MNGPLAGYIKRILLFTLILLAILAIAFIFFLKPYFLSVYIILLLVNLAISITAYAIISKTIHQKSNNFTKYFMAITGIKFLVYLAIFGIYIFLYKENAIPFTIAFFILYLAYSIFEIIEILKFFKNK